MAHKNISEMEGLENKGWDQMVNILDKEMPIKKKRRPVLFWWLGGVAASIVLIIGLTLNESPTSKKVSFQNTNSVTSNSTIQEENKPSDSKIPFETRALTIETPSIINKTEAGRFKQINQLEGNLTVKEITTNSTTTFITSNPTRISENKTKDSSGNLKHIDYSNHRIESINPNVERDYTKQIFSTSLLSSTALTSKLCTNNKIPIPFKIAIIKAPQFNWHLQAIYTHASQKGYSEIGIGLAGKLKTNKRWAFISSLNYHLRNKLFNTGLTEETADITNTPFSAPTQPNTSSQDPFTSPPSNRSLDSANNIKLSQLSFQIGGQYQLTQKWSINGSIIPSFSIINNNKYNTWYNDPTGPNSISMDDQIIPNPKKWNMHTDIGLNYGLSNQLIVGINYSYLISKKDQDSLLNPNFESNEWKISAQYLLD